MEKDLGVEVIRENYAKLVNTYGDDFKSCQYGNKESQKIRFDEITKIADLNGKKVLDIGCGLGDLYAYFLENKVNVNYTGIDIVPEMIALAKGKYSEAEFKVANILEETLDDQYDIVLLNGVFNNNFGDTDRFIEQMLSNAFKYAKEGMGFNFISTYVNFKEDAMAYHNPSTILNYCIENLSRKVNINHHYAKCDVSVFVYK